MHVGRRERVRSSPEVCFERSVSSVLSERKRGGDVGWHAEAGSADETSWLCFSNHWRRSRSAAGAAFAPAT